MCLINLLGGKPKMPKVTQPTPQPPPPVPEPPSPVAKPTSVSAEDNQGAKEEQAKKKGKSLLRKDIGASKGLSGLQLPGS